MMTAYAVPKELKLNTRRFSRSEYYSMAELGFFANERVELIEGEIVKMSPQNSAHSMTSNEIAERLLDVFGKGYFALQHSPLSLPGNSEPEPDVSIIKGARRDFFDENPTTAELVVEVSLSTYAFDRNQKTAIYARGGIPEYWIVNLVKSQLEVFWNPQQVSGKIYHYSNSQIYLPGSTVSPRALPKSKIAVSNLLPPVKAK